MKAKLVKDCLNEKFSDKTDPIKDMNIGYPASQMNSYSWKILKFIEEKGEVGAKLGEIQYFIWTELEGHDPTEFWEKRFGGRKTRGHWNTRLIGSSSSGWGDKYYQGILYTYCKKDPVTKRWILKRLPKPREKFFKKV